MNDAHEHDEEELGVPQPIWRFSAWDMVGIVTFGASGVLNAAAQTCGLLAREFSAAANYARQQHDLREAQEAYAEHQRAIGEDLARLIEGPDS